MVNVIRREFCCIILVGELSVALLSIITVCFAHKKIHKPVNTYMYLTGKTDKSLAFNVDKELMLAI